MIVLPLFALFFLGFYFILNALIKPSQPIKNHYIIAHQKKMADDKMYEQYLDFCKKNGELPLEKKGFEELRKKEENLNQQINKALK